MNLQYQGLGNYTDFDCLSSTDGYHKQNGIRDGRYISVLFKPKLIFGLTTIVTMGRSNLLRVIPIRYFQDFLETTIKHNTPLNGQNKKRKPKTK
jgi:hypothetical protein